MEDRLTMLPPPPRALTMLRARALAKAYRSMETVVRLGRAARRRVTIAIASRRSDVPDARPEEQRLSWLVKRIVDERARAAEDRQTAVEIKRGS